MTPTDPARWAAALRQAAPGTVWLDTARAGGEEDVSLLFVEPEYVLQAHRLAEVPERLRALDEAVADGYHAAGFVAYEAGYAFEDIGETPEGTPLLWLGLYREPIHLDQPAADQGVQTASQGAAYTLEGARFGLERAVYADRIGRIKQHIHAGDVYQINFTDRVAFAFEGDPLGLYRDLRRRQPVAYGAYLVLEDRHILCLSPELFFWRRGDHIVTRPMKGTVRRGRTRAEDDALANWLAHDAKSRAENLMIVDLLRNDLSHGCRPGTVRVPALFETERYETVIQMTSTVEGQLMPGIGYADLFRALFPCGSVTGAPKIRAMQFIQALERQARGVYCGAIGYIAPEGRALFNVAIRTVVLQERRGWMGTGSGIVWDSDSDAEYEECLLKAQFLTGAQQEPVPFALIETMRWADGIELLPLHLDRLRDSAVYFSYPFDEAKIRSCIADALAGCAAETPHKVRLTLDQAGVVEVTAEPLASGAPPPLRLTLAAERIDSKEVFFYHKTTRRDVYERNYQQARVAGFDEVLFLNEAGAVTEGSRTNVFIRVGRTYYTPPVYSGLLGGVYRRYLLATLPDVEERVLAVTDLMEADAVYVCNAVHGLIEAALEPAVVTMP